MYNEPQNILLLNGSRAKGILASEFLNARLGKQRLGLGFARMLVSQSIDLGRARAHDVVRRRNILLSRLISHLGLEHLAMVLHALNVLARLVLLHGSVDVPVTEDARHVFLFFVSG